MNINIINGYLEVPVSFYYEIVDDKLMLDAGVAAGLAAGFAVGVAAGLAAGFAAGVAAGLAAGFAACVAPDPLASVVASYRFASGGS